MFHQGGEEPVVGSAHLWVIDGEPQAVLHDRRTAHRGVAGECDRPFGAGRVVLGGEQRGDMRPFRCVPGQIPIAWSGRHVRIELDHRVEQESKPSRVGHFVVVEERHDVACRDELEGGVAGEGDTGPRLTYVTDGQRCASGVVLRGVLIHHRSGRTASVVVDHHHMNGQSAGFLCGQRLEGAGQACGPIAGGQRHQHSFAGGHGVSHERRRRRRRPRVRVTTGGRRSRARRSTPLDPASSSLWPGRAKKRVVGVVDPLSSSAW